jgi:hypothetical protein
LYYVNFPDTPFVAPENLSCLIFSVAYGREYHDENILRKILGQQREAQKQLFDAQADRDAKRPLAECLPKAALRSAKLLSEVNPAGQVELYLHLPVQQPVAECSSPPNTVIGVHDHDDGYSYAVLSLTGDVLVYGDVLIPQHVLKLKRGYIYSDNYAFEAANAMVDLGVAHHAYLGFEQTLWKRQPSLSRAQNQRRFGRPRQKIFDILLYKAPLRGLLQPHLTYGVSPIRACACCGKRWRSGRSGVRRRRTIACYTCSSVELRSDASRPGRVQCLRCSQVWNIMEPVFTCPYCHTSVLARFNTAIVVAQQTLTQLVVHHERRQKKVKGDQIVLEPRT